MDDDESLKSADDDGDNEIDYDQLSDGFDSAKDTPEVKAPKQPV